MTEHKDTEYTVTCTLDGQKYTKVYAAESEEKAIELYKKDLKSQYPDSVCEVLSATKVTKVKKEEKET